MDSGDSRVTGGVYSVSDAISIEKLNHTFGITRGGQGELVFASGPGGLVIARISNAQASATVALQGAHLLEWTPRGQRPVIWLSKDATFAPGKSIRGGIPICWPWFGAHASEADYPAHGFARTAPWQVTAASTLDDGATQLRLALPENETTRALWPHATPVEYTLTVGRQLQLALLTRNKGHRDVTLSQALHTYFMVDDVHSACVTGLDGYNYLDKVQNFARQQQQGTIHFNAEVDRVYLDAPGDCLIHDPGLKRCIRIRKQGSASTVVWNPWQEKSQQMGDMGEQGYQTMLCVESANAADDAVTIAPGGEHCLRVRYDVEPDG